MADLKGFDVVKAYKKALEDEQVPHPIAAILALVELMEASTGMSRQTSFLSSCMRDSPVHCCSEAAENVG